MTSPDRSPLYGWIYRSLYGVAALVIAAGFGFLALFATGRDNYFTPDVVSRWEYAARNGKTPDVVAAFVIALSAVVALALAARSRSSTRMRVFAALVAVVAVALWFIALAALALGH